MSNEYSITVPEKSLTAVLSEQTQLLIPVAETTYQSALTVFGDKIEAQKQLICILLEDLSCRSCAEIRHLSPEQHLVFITELVCRLVKHVCGAEMIAFSTAELAQQEAAE